MGGLIVEKLDVEDWKVNSKALVIMENMTKDPSFAKYADLFYDQKEVLEDLLEETNQAQVRARCKRVLKGLGVEGYDNIQSEVEKKKKVVGRAPMPFEAVEPNLLDMENSTSAPQAPQASGQAEDLLAGLTMSDSAPPVPAEKSGFDF